MFYNKRKKRITAALLALLLMVTMGACKKKEASIDFTPDPSLYNFSEEAGRSIDILRNGKTEDGEVLENFEEFYCALAYLGHVDTSECYISSNQQLFYELLDDNGYADKYAFLKEITSFNIFESTDGTELYCLVPSAQAENVSIQIPEGSLVPEYVYMENAVQLSVNHDDPDENGMCLLYDRNNSDPVLFCVNSEEAASEAQVTIKLSGGNTKTFSPQLRKSDGRLEVSSGVFDFTIYTAYLDENSFSGEWICNNAEDDLGNKRSIYLNLGSSKDGSQVNFSYRALNGINAEMDLFTYSGTWSDAPVGMADYAEGCIILDLESNGGVYQDAGAPIHQMQSILAISQNIDNSDEIIVRCVSGDPLLPGTMYQDLIFSRL